MGRTQVYLRAEDLELLDRAVERTGASRSELIRRAVHAAYGADAPSPQERLAGLRAARGIWKDRNFTADEYVRAIRSGDANVNLRRLGVE